METEKHTEIHLSTDANSFEKITTDERRKVVFCFLVLVLFMYQKAYALIFYIKT